MAAHFGAVTPARAYALRVRWLVGALVSMIVVLAAAFIVVVQNRTDSTGTAAATEPIALSLVPGTAEIVVAANRIEEGTELHGSLFTTVAMKEDETPMGALRKRDLAKLDGRFAARLLNPGAAVLDSDITSQRRLSSLNIPEGYRAVTIVADRRTSVEGFARPDSRVDVLWTFQRGGAQQVATIVRSAKILSVAGATAHAAAGGAAPSDNQGLIPVTLLTTERDAKKVELARSLGSVSLSLLGEHETVAANGDPDSIDVNSLLNIPPPEAGPDAEPEAQGIVYFTDPNTGRQQRYVLPSSGGRWKRDKDY